MQYILDPFFSSRLRSLGFSAVRFLLALKDQSAGTGRRISRRCDRMIRSVIPATIGQFWETSQEVASASPGWRSGVHSLNTIDEVINWSNSTIPKAI